MLLEITDIEYKLSAGSFRIDNAKIYFREPDLAMPLVQNVMIGTYSDERELALCHGSLKNGPSGNGRFSRKYEGFRFHPRPSYNGQKIIFPNTPIYQISRTHGEIVISAPAHAKYVHKTINLPTILWNCSQGIIMSVCNLGETIDDLFDPNKCLPQTNYLLLGGYNNGGLKEKFPSVHHYIKLEANRPRLAGTLTERGFGLKPE